MKTMQKLIEKFNKQNPNHTAELDTFDSYRGYYKVYIGRSDWWDYSTLTFKSCKEFKEWMDGVVLY